MVGDHVKSSLLNVSYFCRREELSRRDFRVLIRLPRRQKISSWLDPHDQLFILDPFAEPSTYFMLSEEMHLSTKFVLERSLYAERFFPSV